MDTSPTPFAAIREPEPINVMADSPARILIGFAAVKQRSDASNTGNAC
jgi:hypothetical protein